MDNHLEKYISENNLLEGMDPKLHEYYKKEVSKTLDFGLYVTRESFKVFLNKIMKW